MITVYGIRQCDTCRKALEWLHQRGLPHRFHDLRVDGLEPERLNDWLASPFAERLVNRRSTTWRGLGTAQKAATGTALQRLLLAQPTLIKRPVFEDHGIIAVGFDPTELECLVG